MSRLVIRLRRRCRTPKCLTKSDCRSGGSFGTLASPERLARTSRKRRHITAKGPVYPLIVMAVMVLVIIRAFGVATGERVPYEGFLAPPCHLVTRFIGGVSYSRLLFCGLFDLAQFHLGDSGKWADRSGKELTISSKCARRWWANCL